MYIHFGVAKTPPLYTLYSQWNGPILTFTKIAVESWVFFWSTLGKNFICIPSGKTFRMRASKDDVYSWVKKQWFQGCKALFFMADDQLEQMEKQQNLLLGGGFTFQFFFHPYLGRWSNLTSIVLKFHRSSCFVSLIMTFHDCYMGGMPPFVSTKSLKGLFTVICLFVSSKTSDFCE